MSNEHQAKSVAAMPSSVHGPSSSSSAFTVSHLNVILSVIDVAIVRISLGIGSG